MQFLKKHFDFTFYILKPISEVIKGHFRPVLFYVFKKDINPTERRREINYSRLGSDNKRQLISNVAAEIPGWKVQRRRRASSKKTNRGRPASIV